MGRQLGVASSISYKREPLPPHARSSGFTAVEAAAVAVGVAEVGVVAGVLLCC